MGADWLALPEHDEEHGEAKMKVAGAVLAVLGMLLVALGALRHFSAFILADLPNASTILIGAGIAGMILGAVVARLGADPQDAE